MRAFALFALRASLYGKVRRLSPFAMLQLISGAACAAVGSRNKTIPDRLFGDLSGLAVVPLAGSLLIFVAMIAIGAWKQALVTFAIGSGALLGISVLPVLGYLVVGLGFGPWLLFIVFVVGCALSRDAGRAESRLE